MTDVSATATVTIAGRFELAVRADSERCHWDIGICNEVVTSDCYHVQALRDIDIRTVVDVGAHIGSFSVLAASLWPSAKIVAFEPDNENFALLRENTARYGVVASVSLVGTGAGREAVHAL